MNHFFWANTGNFCLSVTHQRTHQGQATCSVPHSWIGKDGDTTTTLLARHKRIAYYGFTMDDIASRRRTRSWSVDELMQCENNLQLIYVYFRIHRLSQMCYGPSHLQPCLAMILRPPWNDYCWFYGWAMDWCKPYYAQVASSVNKSETQYLSLLFGLPNWNGFRVW